MSRIRVLLADDQRIIREGLRSLLEACPDIDVVGEAGDGDEAFALVREYHPDVVLMDIRMPGTDGVEATRRIKSEFPSTAIIVLTTFDDDSYIIAALAYGASGYLLKDIGSHQLIEAIRDGVRGSIILPGSIAAKLATRLPIQGRSSADRMDFTEREQEIIRLLVQGKNNREIAGLLFLSVGTVKNYISQIYSKAEITDRANAVLYFRELGF